MKKRKMMRIIMKQQKDEVRILHDIIARLINSDDNTCEDSSASHPEPVKEPGKHTIIPLEPEFTKFYQ